MASIGSGGGRNSPSPTRTSSSSRDFNGDDKRAIQEEIMSRAQLNSVLSDEQRKPKGEGSNDVLGKHIFILFLYWYHDHDSAHDMVKLTLTH